MASHSGHTLRNGDPEDSKTTDDSPKKEDRHWKTTTFLAALRCTGLTAPLVIDGGINGAMFLTWVKKELAPTLQPEDIVIMDNLSSHKVKGVHETIEAVGARVLFLPP